MSSFADSYLGRLRKLVGSRLLLVPGARIIVEDEHGRILLQQRSDFGVWGLPGGTAEEGESVEAVVIREAAEEVGLVVRDVEPFGFGCDPQYETVTFPNGDQCQFFVLMFCTRSFDGLAAVRDDESRAVGWFTTNDLPEMLPNMVRSVDAYLRFRQTGKFQLI
jgi:ADP-ribose pyrophosphatase YjhB (NUDIX family)